MTTPDDGAEDGADAPPVSRWPHVLRLALFAAFLLTLFYFVAVSRVVDVGQVRDAVAATGPVAPLAYLLVAAVLAAVFVPGPLLAAGSGFLFGPLVGTFVTLGSTVTTAMITALVGTRDLGQEVYIALTKADRKLLAKHGAPETPGYTSVAPAS